METRSQRHWQEDWQTDTGSGVDCDCYNFNSKFGLDMKILIITSNRSGSTFLYEVLAGYIAPDQRAWTRKHTDRMRFDEPFKESLSKLRNTNNVNACLTQSRWVIKILVDDINPDTSPLLLKLIRESDLIVKLWRNPAERTISRLIAKQDNNYGPKGVDTESINIDYELVKRQVHDTINSVSRLESQPSDIEVDYSDLKYPRQIVSDILGIPKQKIPPMQEVFPKNSVIFSIEKLTAIRDLMDRACDEYSQPRWEGMDWNRYLGKK